MIICAYEDSGVRRYGVVDGEAVFELEGDLFSPEPRRGRRIAPLSELALLVPIVPSKIICVGRNYAAHAKERGADIPAEPLLFFKPPSAVIAQNQAIELLPDMGRVEHEAELAVIMGKRARFVEPEQALELALGYTCANDVSARDYQSRDGQWARAKGFDTFCPLGPWIATRLDPSAVRVRCRVNGEIRQDASTSDLIFDIPFLIAHISRVMTLYPGDVILTGTPAGVSPIQDGDQIEVEIDGIGQLRNPVRMREASL